MKLTVKSQEIFDMVKNGGGRVTVDALAEATGRTTRSVGANINDLCNKGLAAREKVAVEGQDKEVTYVVLTDEGKTFVPSAE